MRVTRVYSDERGESHFADQKVETQGRRPDREPVGEDSRKGGHLPYERPGYDYDWHVAPQRQFIVLLDGAIEIEVSDGERRTFRGGEVLLMEDTTGRRYRTRHVEARERRSVFILLDQEKHRTQNRRSEP
jgi:hypothetical protein